MQRIFAILWLTIGAALTLLLLWATDLPLGVPGEWTWLRLPADDETLSNLLLAAAGAALYVAVVWTGGTRLMTHGITRAEAGVWLLVLACAGFGWLWCVQETAPTAGSLGKAPFVLYYPGASGYFTHARYAEPNVQKFLAGYEALMGQGDVLHVGTHPPGLFCVFYGLGALVDRNPGFESWLVSTQPESVRDALAVIATNSASTKHPLTPRDGAILWLATLIVQALAVATVIPLYGLLRWTMDRPAAFASAALWPAVPAAAVFVPKSDAAYPFLAALVVWLIVSAWRQPRVITGFLAGLIALIGLFCSLAFLPVLAFAAGWCALDVLQGPVPLPPSTGERGRARGRSVSVIAAILGFAIPIVGLWAATGMNLINVWWLNYHNHAGFYAQFPRTYALWLAVNPLELSIAVGWPLMGAALGTAVSWLRPRGGEGGRGRGGEESSGYARLPPPLPLSPSPPLSHRRRALLIGAGVWFLLWLTGKNSGEAARLWLLLMPGIVWLAAHFPQPESTVDPSRAPSSLGARIALLALSLAVCVLTVHRVGGFHPL